MNARAASRIALAVVIAVVALVAYGIYVAGLNERPAPPSSSNVIFKAGSAEGRRIAFKSWSADYDRIFSNSDQTMLELDGVKHGIIYRAGKPYLAIRAQHMSVNTISRDFTVTGPLHVETLTGKAHRSFDTTAAVWNDSPQTLTLSKPTTIFTGTPVPLSVGGLTLNVRTGEISVTAVSGAIRFK